MEIICISETLVVLTSLYGVTTQTNNIVLNLPVLFDSYVAKKQIISKGDEMTGSRTKLHFEKMRILYPLPNIRTIRTKESELDESSSTNEGDRKYVHILVRKP
jgi:hypothetical protein